jgi:hypothetical protein
MMILHREASKALSHQFSYDENALWRKVIESISKNKEETIKDLALAQLITDHLARDKTFDERVQKAIAILDEDCKLTNPPRGFGQKPSVPTPTNPKRARYKRDLHERRPDSVHDTWHAVRWSDLRKMLQRLEKSKIRIDPPKPGDEASSNERTSHHPFDDLGVETRKLFIKDPDKFVFLAPRHEGLKDEPFDKSALLWQTDVFRLMIVLMLKRYFELGKMRTELKEKGTTECVYGPGNWTPELVTMLSNVANAKVLPIVTETRQPPPPPPWTHVPLLSKQDIQKLSQSKTTPELAFKPAPQMSSAIEIAKKVANLKYVH